MIASVNATYSDIHTFANLYTAYRKAAQGKRARAAAARFEFRLEDNLIQLQQDLNAGLRAITTYCNATSSSSSRPSTTPSCSRRSTGASRMAASAS